ncbi:phage tail protein [Providencia rettgeri]
MSSSVITIAFEGWKAQEAASGKAVLLDEFVFANVPNLDPSKPIDRNEKLPPANQIVHRQLVNKAGLASENAVAYSVTLGAEVGDFDFNWIGLINKESDVVAMITHAPVQKKLKTKDGQQGNVLMRSFLLEFNGAAKETQITTNAETWQIDFTARLSGIDEMQRLINVDNYGEAAFFNDGFEVTRTSEQFTVKKGLGYIGGLRGQLEKNQILNGLRNTKIYADFSYQGNIVSQWNTVIKITSAATLNNYVDAAGFTHQVFAIASIDASGNVKDLRPKGALSTQSIIELEKTVNDGLDGKQDKGDYALRGESYTKVESNLKFQATGDYATKGELKTGLDSKLGKEAIVQYGGGNEDVTMSQKAVTEMAAKKLDKTGGELTGVLFFRELLSNKLEGTNRQVLNSSSASVYLGNPVSVDEVRLQTNSGIAIVDVGGKSYRIYHEGYEPSSVPIGGGVLWSATAPIPSNFWANEGRSFSEKEYPEAAKIFPDLKLPDDRGYAIRIADNGRGIDSGRTVGTYQEDAIQSMRGDFSFNGGESATGSGVFQASSNLDYKLGHQSSSAVAAKTQVSFDPSRQVRVANETRMKNVSKILITRMK